MEGGEPGEKSTFGQGLGPCLRFPESCSVHQGRAARPTTRRWELMTTWLPTASLWREASGSLNGPRQLSSTENRCNSTGNQAASGTPSGHKCERSTLMRAPAWTMKQVSVCLPVAARTCTAAWMGTPELGPAPEGHVRFGGSLRAGFSKQCLA